MLPVVFSPYIDRLAVYPIVEHLFRRQSFVYHPSASLDVLDGLNPAIVDMRIAFAVGEFLLIVVHRAAQATNPIVALVVQLAMLNTECIQE